MLYQGTHERREIRQGTQFVAHDAHADGGEERTIRQLSRRASLRFFLRSQLANPLALGVWREKTGQIGPAICRLTRFGEQLAPDITIHRSRAVNGFRPAGNSVNPVPIWLWHHSFRIAARTTFTIILPVGSYFKSASGSTK